MGYPAAQTMLAQTATMAPLAGVWRTAVRFRGVAGRRDILVSTWRVVGTGGRGVGTRASTGGPLHTAVQTSIDGTGRPLQRQAPVDGSMRAGNRHLCPWVD